MEAQLSNNGNTIFHKYGGKLLETSIKKMARNMGKTVKSYEVKKSMALQWKYSVYYLTVKFENKSESNGNQITLDTSKKKYYKDYEYRLLENGTVEITNYFGSNTKKKLTIPRKIVGRTVTGIGMGTFANCYWLKNVTIPEGVKSIGDGAFEDCINLVSIDIPLSITYIERRAFLRCEMVLEYK